MATLSDLRTTLASALRDTGNATFSTTELDDLINQGIDEVGFIYPREIVQTVATVATDTYTYDVSSFTNIYRIDLYTSDGVYRATIPHGIGDGPDSGWETHAGVLHLPPSWAWEAGDTIRAFGYAGYTQLAASTSTTDLDTSAQMAVIVFAEVEAFQRLLSDRAKYQQYQSESNNTDVTALQMASLAAGAKNRWDRQRQRLRRIRKLG